MSGTTSEQITKLMDTYKKKLDDQDTAEEMNRNTQHLFIYDYIYLFCKVILFIILGVAYYLWVWKKEVADAYETTKETVVKANEKINQLKESVPIAQTR